MMMMVMMKMMTMMMMILIISNYWEVLGKVKITQDDFTTEETRTVQDYLWIMQILEGKFPNYGDNDDDDDEDLDNQ